MAKNSKLAPSTGDGDGVPARLADAKIEYVGSKTDADRAAAATKAAAEAGAPEDIIAALRARWYASEDAQLATAVEIGRKVDRPGSGARTDVRVAKTDVKGDATSPAPVRLRLFGSTELAGMLRLSASTVTRFSYLALLHDERPEDWRRAIDERRAAGKRVSIDELAALASLPLPNDDAPKPKRVPRDVAPRARKILVACTERLHDLRGLLPTREREADRAVLLEAIREVAAVANRFMPDAPDGAYDSEDDDADFLTCARCAESIGADESTKKTDDGLLCEACAKADGDDAPGAGGGS